MGHLSAKLFRKLLTATASILAVSVFCITCLYFEPAPIARLNNLIYDTCKRLSDNPEPHPVPAIVEIDDRSLTELGQWPWPRTLMADLIDRIFEGGALAVGLDILLPEADRTSPDFLKRAMESRHGLEVKIEGIPPDLMDNDLYLAESIKDKPVVLGAFATFQQGKLPDELPRQTGLIEISPPEAASPRANLRKTKGLIIPLRTFSDVAPIGIINSTIDEDGIVRSVPLLIRAGDNVYAALSLRTLMAALNISTLQLQSDKDGIAFLRAGDLAVPAEYDGTFRPVYKGRARTYPYYSAVDILEGRIGRKELEGKIIFVGASAIGLLDIRSTPLDPAMPGVEVHATLVDNMISGSHISIPSQAAGLQIIAVFLTAALSLALFSFLPAIVYAFGAVVLIAACLCTSWLFYGHGIFVSPVYTILAAILMGALIIPMRFWREQKAKKQIKGAFSHYVAPEIVNRIVANGTSALNGQTREVSILFTDVRNFTTISEKMEPGQLVRLLNSYFTPMTACVISRDGTLDKFIGDALMAFWNAPLDVESHQQKAVLAALDMQRKLAELGPQFLRDFGAEIKIGAGIHAGAVQVGNMGSEDLLNYTCIGDNVNLASRLEGLSKRYGAGIIVSSAVMVECHDLRFRQLDRIRVKGSSRPLDIYTPIEQEDKLDEICENRWTTALDAYFAGDFKLALSIFEALANKRWQETATRLFIARCANLREQKPENWDGVWAYDSK